MFATETPENTEDKYLLGALCVLCGKKLYFIYHEKTESVLAKITAKHMENAEAPEKTGKD
ncbi:MAG TPA: hypothetical protein C5S37_01690 [Methanophagales archaeon]|nr:hypothetical protein [Methanophagales archaeon]